MSNNSSEKVKEILEELSFALTETESIPQLAKKIGYSKATLYGWVSNGKIPLKSVKDRVPNVNTAFLRSGEGEPLLQDKYEKAVSGLTNQPAGEGKPYNARDLLLEALEVESERIQNDLQGLTERIRKLRKMSD